MKKKPKPTKKYVLRHGSVLHLPRNTRVTGPRVLTPETPVECYVNTFIIRAEARGAIAEWTEPTKPARTAPAKPMPAKKSAKED